MKDNAVPVYYLALGVGPLPGIGPRWVWLHHYRHGPNRTETYCSFGEIPNRIIADLTHEQLNALKEHFRDPEGINGG